MTQRELPYFVRQTHCKHIDGPCLRNHLADGTFTHPCSEKLIEWCKSNYADEYRKPEIADYYNSRPMCRIREEGRRGKD